jgi:hypothetical protein
VAPHLIPRGLSHLQYADETLILIQYDKEQLVNLKFMLLCFEEMSGLKINYLKSEVIVLGSLARFSNEWLIYGTASWVRSHSLIWECLYLTEN